MTETRSPQEQEAAMIATALMSMRVNGRIVAPTPVEAANLLGSIDSYNVGQGAFNVLVPKSKVRELGLNQELWEEHATPMSEGNTSYDVDYETGAELIGRLEVIAGKKWNEAKALRQNIDASRAERKIG